MNKAECSFPGDTEKLLTTLTWWSRGLMPEESTQCPRKSTVGAEKKALSRVDVQAVGVEKAEKLLEIMKMLLD
jgi:hypothetical protein